MTRTCGGRRPDPSGRWVTNSLAMAIETNDPRSVVPELRIRQLNEKPIRPDGRFVLYWMTSYYRTRSNFALQRASEWARQLHLPLVVLSVLQLDYKWASDRLHAFALDSLADVGLALADTNAVFFNYVEPRPGDAKGLPAALARDAAVVVGDDAPLSSLPELSTAMAGEIEVRMEAVDHNSLVPLAATDRVFLRAVDLRRFLQTEMPRHLDDVPADGIGGLPQAPHGLVEAAGRRWPISVPHRDAIASLPLDHGVGATSRIGGQLEAHRMLEQFLIGPLKRYEQRNHPDDDASSGLSPFLRFGNISPHEIFGAVASSEGWHPGRLSDRANGARAGWWGMSPGAEAFLDQVVTWRELGYRAAARVPDNDAYSAIPKWARATLADHVDDPRAFLYSFDQFDSADTHDDIWNAAQIQLRTEGTIHNYLRMLWGKKILEWTRHPEEAHDIMFELNNRYAVDGRDPNSVSGIHWVLGRYDRAWGPERAIFGKVRYMSSESAKRKLRMSEYQSKMLNT